MTFGHRHITPMLLALLLTIGVALTACSSTDEPTPGPDPSGPEPQTHIGLYLNLPVLTDGAASSALTSRTPTDGPDGPASYDPGYGYENYIDLNGKDYRIYVFTPDNQLYTEVSTDSVDIVSWNFTQFSRIYGLSFPVDKNFHTKFNGADLKLVVLANWHNKYPENLHPMVPYVTTDGNTSGNSTGGSNSCTTLTELLSYTEDAAGFMNYMPVTPALAHETRIPLFGVTEFKTVNILTNLLTWLGNVDLLRAVAKIDVYDAPNTTAPITAVSLTRYNTALAKAPAGITSHGDYVHGSYNPDYVNTPTIPVRADGNNCEASDPISLKPDSPDNGHFIIYVPEYRNIESNGTPRSNGRSRLSLTFKDVGTCEIDFKYYNEPPANSGYKKGDHFNILRNYWYRFEVNKLPDGVVVQVVPYAISSLKPGFGLIINKDLVPVYDDEGSIIYYYNPETGTYYDKDGVTELDKNPFIFDGVAKDPATGYDIVRDDHGTFLYFYDAVTGKYYDADMNEIEKP